MTIGQMVYQFLTKLDWFSTLFPRVPVPIEKQIEKKLAEFSRTNNVNFHKLHQQTTSAAPARAMGSSGGSGNGVGSGGSGNYSGRAGGSYLERDRDREPYDRRRTDDREFHARERESRYNFLRDDRRDGRYERSRSRDREYRGDREKHKKKHKNRDRSRSRERREREYVRERSVERYKEHRDYDRRYR